MPKGNKRLDADQHPHHNWALWANDGNFGPYVTADITHGYRKEGEDKLTPSTSFTLKELAEDIALRTYIYQRAVQQQRLLKQKTRLAEKKDAKQPAHAK